MGWPRLLPAHAVGHSVLLESDASCLPGGYVKLYRTLVEQYPGLQDQISRALFQLFEPYVAHWKSGAHIPRSSKEMIARTELDCVTFEVGGTLELAYGLRPDVGWDDAMLSIELKGSVVSPRSLDD